METIDKARLAWKYRTEKVDINRTCGNCVAFNGEDWCKMHQHPTRRIQYGCKTHTTKEQYELLEKRFEDLKNGEQGIRVNYMLTLMYVFISGAYTLMCKAEHMMKGLIGGQEWRHERKKALNQINADIKHISDLYARYFENDFISMLSDQGREQFDEFAYSGFNMFTGHFIQLGLEFFERGYHNPVEVLDKMLEYMRQMPNDLDLFDEKFIDQFKVRAND